MSSEFAKTFKILLTSINALGKYKGDLTKYLRTSKEIKVKRTLKIRDFPFIYQENSFISFFFTVL